MKVDTDISARQLADTIVDALQDKKANDIVIMDLRKLRGAMADYFVVCSGTSDNHIQPFSNTCVKEVGKKLKDKLKNVEGRPLGEWILLDYFNVVVHIFQEERRTFFDIESLWGDAKIEKIKQAW